MNQSLDTQRLLDGVTSSTEVVAPGVQTLVNGELTYTAEVWKCSDIGSGTDEVDNYWYYGYKSGYDGGGTGWSYSDPFQLREVECYGAPEADAGQVPCEAWANSPPVYTAFSTLVLQGFVTDGTTTWDTLLIPQSGGVAWIGDYEGTDHHGVAPVSAKIIGFL